MEYKTVYEPAKDSFVERKSEFIGHIAPVKTNEQAVDFINSIKAQHRKARHNVYAYILRDGNITRYSDDGEPQGTGGVPVLDVLQKEGLCDVCVVVTRYFGGILLGGGGLVRAYSNACKLAVDAARIMIMRECSQITVKCDYSLYGKITYVLPDYDVKIKSENFADDVEVTLFVKSELADALKEKLTDLSNGKISLEEITSLWADFA
ncbi:MAG: YigZ family protein [Ruminococcus sp.]|nr:YigZ family protein [Ruminococcus sp.]